MEENDSERKREELRRVTERTDPVEGVEIELLEHSRPEDRAAWLGGDNLGRIEHIAIEVEDLDATLTALRALGVTGEPVRPGSLGVSVRTHPDTTTGIVLQLLQPDRSRSVS